MDREYINYIQRHSSLTERQAQEWYNYVFGKVVMPKGLHQYLTAVSNRIGMCGDILMDSIAEFIKIRDDNWLPRDDWTKEFLQSCYSDIQWKEPMLDSIRRYFKNVKANPNYWADWFTPYATSSKKPNNQS